MLRHLLSDARQGLRPHLFSWYMKNDDGEDDDDDDNAPRRRGGASTHKTPEVVVAHYGADPKVMAGQIIALEDDNFHLRQQRKEFRAEIKALKESGPQEDGLVLTPEQAKDWKAYQELGVPKDLKDKLAKHDELSKKVSSSERAALLAGIAKDSGMDAEVLAELDSMSSVPVDYVNREMMDPETKQKVPAWVVSYQDGDTKKEEAVSDYYKRVYPKFESILFSDQPGQPFRADQEPRPIGRSFPTQRVGSNGAHKQPSVAQAILERDYAEPKPDQQQQ